LGWLKQQRTPKISAALLDKADDLKLQVDEPGARQRFFPNMATPAAIPPSNNRGRSLLPAAAGAQTIEKKGTTPYVTHFVFRPIMSIDIAELGKATTLEAVGTTQNMKGEKMLDKMSAQCVALNVAPGDKKYIDGQRW
jgi:hypothetical protein